MHIYTPTHIFYVPSVVSYRSSGRQRLSHLPRHLTHTKAGETSGADRQHLKRGEKEVDKGQNYEGEGEKGKNYEE